MFFGKGNSAAEWFDRSAGFADVEKVSNHAAPILPLKSAQTAQQRASGRQRVSRGWWLVGVALGLLVGCRAATTYVDSPRSLSPVVKQPPAPPAQQAAAPPNTSTPARLASAELASSRRVPAPNHLVPPPAPLPPAVAATPNVPVSSFESQSPSAAGPSPMMTAANVDPPRARGVLVRTSAVLPARSSQMAQVQGGRSQEAMLAGGLGGVPALTLPLALQTALEQNPDLVALRQSEGVSQAIVGVANAFPFNPFFQFQATPVEQAPAAAKAQEKNAAQKIFQYYLVMHTFELAHQRRHRTNVAEAQLRSVRWNIYQAELQNMAVTEQFFFTAIYQRGLRDLAEASAKLSGQLLSITERQMEAGQASASDVATVRVDARAARQQARLAEANYRTALLALRRQLNLRLDAPIEPAGDLAGFDWMPVNGEQLSRYPALSAAIGRGENLDGIVRELAGGRPDVMAARWTANAAQANVRLAQASRVPNLIFGPYYQSDDFGIRYFGFRGQIDVPVANSGKPLVRQRAAELRQQQVVAAQLRARAEQEVRAAIDRYERARLLAQESAADLGDGLPVELARLERQFQANEVDVMRVVTARTSLLQLRRAYLDSLNELATAAAVVTAATGLPPEALVRPTAEPVPPPLPPLPAPTDVP